MFLVYLLLLNLNLLFNKTGKEVLLFSLKIVPGNEFAVILFYLFYLWSFPGAWTPSPKVCCCPEHHFYLQVLHQSVLSCSVERQC